MLELTRGTLSAPCCCAGRSPVPHLHVIVSPEPGSHAPSREHGIFLPFPFHAFQGRQRFQARACRQGGDARPSALSSRGNRSEGGRVGKACERTCGSRCGGCTKTQNKQ